MLPSRWIIGHRIELHVAHNYYAVVRFWVGYAQYKHDKDNGSTNYWKFWPGAQMCTVLQALKFIWERIFSKHSQTLDQQFGVNILSLLSNLTEA